jgi:hypothetical protein
MRIGRNVEAAVGQQDHDVGVAAPIAGRAEWPYRFRRHLIRAPERKSEGDRREAVFLFPQVTLLSQKGP